MLRQISYRVLSATSELCRVSPTLAKLLTYETNSRTYRGQGITYDDDSTYEEPETFDSSTYRRKQSSRTYRGQGITYDGDDSVFDESFDAPTYRPKQGYSKSRSNYNEFEKGDRTQYRDNDSSYRKGNQFRNRDSYDDRPFEKGDRTQYRDYNESSYRKGNQFRNRDSYDDRPFRRPSYGQNLNQNSFGQSLVKPVFDINNLPPVEKHFYVEHPDVTQRTPEEVKSYRDRLNISVRGSDVPKPITSFEELCLPDNLKNAVCEQEYSEPTPIQAQGWPIALSGRDMVGISQTGSGKTLVFVLPAIIHALNQSNSGDKENGRKPQVLVLAPTRELVQQIMGVSDRFSNSCGLLSSCAYGGASRNYQLQCLRGANICIATPGRLIDFVSEGLVDLQQCTYLVLDEADRMLDMGFEPQIRNIVTQIRPNRQTLMWSATWPREIQNLAEDFLTDYVQVTVGSGELVANPKIEQNIHVIEEDEKENRLVSLLQGIASEDGNKVLIFAQTKRKVDFLGRHLNSLGIPVMCIHGDVSQSRRDHVLNTFRRRKSCVLVATDVAARGLDITDVRCVVNYDFPTNIEDYIHRIGRTARGDASGTAHSFFTHENAGVAKDLLSVLKQANQNIPQELNYMVSNLQMNKTRGSNYMSRKFDFRKRQTAF